MFTDIVGYSALMSRDEKHAHQIIHKSRDILKQLIEQYNGEWLQAVGDGTLSSFASVVEGVNCALEIQRSLRSEPELSLRIGIHVGDVVFAEGEVYGDGVNVASRLEQLAAPGGICVSGRVYSEIRNKPGIEAIFMGEKTLKNVDLPMKVYALAVEELPAAVAKSRIARKLTKLKPRPLVKRAWLYAGAASLIVILAAAGYLLWRNVSEPLMLRLTNATPVTSTIGVEDYPTWSPEGGRLAYESNQSGNWDIWVRQTVGGPPLNLTEDYKGADRCPSWSPDGSQIAFFSSRDGGGCFIIPAIGGPPRKVVNNFSWSSERPQWSADGTALAFVKRDSTGYFIEIVSLLGASSRRLSLPEQIFNVWELSWSPDGRFFAYVTRLTSYSPTSRLWVLRAADGMGFPVTEEGTVDCSPGWLADSRYLYFVSNRGGSMDLWRLGINKNGRPAGEPRQLTTGLDLKYAKFSQDGKKLAYSKKRSVSNLWRLPILEERPATWMDARQLTFLQANIIKVDVSADGKKLVFHSDLDGMEHLWMMPAEGGEPQRVTMDPMMQATPAWSPDGKEIAFHSSRGGNRDIWVVPLGGGAVRQVSRHEAVDVNADWSPDGREIAFSSDRSGNRDIWVIPAQGGEARQITFDPASDNEPRWSPDGQWLLFISDRLGESRLWKVPAAGGNPVPVTEETGSWGVWSPDSNKIYFNRADNIWEVPFERGPERRLTDLTGKAGFLNAGPGTDGQYLYFIWGEEEGEIWVMNVVK